MEGTPGIGVDVATTISLVKQAIDANQWQTTLSPAMTNIPPSRTIADIQANFTQIAKFSTMYDFKGTAESTPEQMEFIPNRAFNVEKAASAISKFVVKPGKTFSFNDIVGDLNLTRGINIEAVPELEGSSDPDMCPVVQIGDLVVKQATTENVMSVILDATEGGLYK